MFLNFKTIENIRDLGGIKTADGHTIKNKLLYRSGDLHLLSCEELELLKNEYNLKEVIDFRSTNSSIKKKDRLDDSIIYHHNFVLKELETHSYNKDIKVTPDQFFIHIYQSLALNKGAIETYRKFFKYLLECHNGAILWHCTSGKDRTGIATVMVLYSLGCDLDTIYKEHFKTNEFTYPQYEAKLKEIGNYTKSENDYYAAFYIAKKEYLDEYFNSIKKVYGSFDKYMENIIGVTRSIRNILREKYLE